MSSFKPLTQEVDSNTSGPLVALNDVTTGSVQVVSQNGFDGIAILEITNDGQNWVEEANPANGIVDVPANKKGARIRTTGTQGSVKLTWIRQYH